MASLLPPERRELAGRAWPAIELRQPRPARTAPASSPPISPTPPANRRPRPALLVECARRALAERRAGHRRGHGPPRPPSGRRRRVAIALDADEVLVHVLAAAGKPLDALAARARRSRTGSPRRARPPTRRADLLVALARAAVAGGDLDAAPRSPTEARTRRSATPPRR